MWCMAMSGGEGREWEQPQSGEQGEMGVSILGDLRGAKDPSCEEQENPCLAGFAIIKKMYGKRQGEGDIVMDEGRGLGEP